MQIFNHLRESLGLALCDQSAFAVGWPNGRTAREAATEEAAMTEHQAARTVQQVHRGRAALGQQLANDGFF